MFLNLIHVSSSVMPISDLSPLSCKWHCPQKSSSLRCIYIYTANGCAYIYIYPVNAHNIHLLEISISNHVMFHNIPIMSSKVSLQSAIQLNHLPVSAAVQLKLWSQLNLDAITLIYISGAYVYMSNLTFITNNDLDCNGFYYISHLANLHLLPLIIARFSIRHYVRT